MKIEKQVKLWKYAAWTLPFVALAIIIFTYFINPTDYLDKTVILICSTFVAVSVFWWWWALDKLLDLVKEKLALGNKLGILAKELREIKKDIRHDLDNRQR